MSKIEERVVGSGEKDVVKEASGANDTFSTEKEEEILWST